MKPEQLFKEDKEICHTFTESNTKFKEYNNVGERAPLAQEGKKKKGTKLKFNRKL